MIPLSPTFTPAQNRRKVRPLKLSERDIKSSIIGTPKAPGFVRVEGWEPIRLQSGVVRGVTRGSYITLCRPGTLDWICVRGKNYFFLETKSPTGKLRDSQLEWIAWAERTDVPFIVADGLGVFMQEYRRMGY